MPSCRAISFNHVDCDFNKCRGRAEIAGYYHRCPYVKKEDMEVPSKDDYQVIKKEDKEVSSDEEPLSPVQEKVFKKYEAPSTNVNLTDRYNNLRIVRSQTPLRFRFTTSNPVMLRNEGLDHLIRLLEGTKKPILTTNTHKPLSNQELAAIVRNATKNVDSQLDTIHPNFQPYRCQHWTDCYDY